MILKSSLMVLSMLMCIGLFISINVLFASLGTKIQNHLPKLDKGEDIHE